MKLDIRAWAITAPILTAVSYIVCALVVAVAPELALFLMAFLFHFHADIAVWQLSWGQSVVALVFWTVGMGLLAAVFAWLHNLVIRKQPGLRRYSRQPAMPFMGKPPYSVRRYPSMKRSLLVLATGIFIAVFTAGAAFAAEPPSGQSSSDSSQAPGRKDSTGEYREFPARLPPEAPWISLALANAQSIGLSPEQQRALETLRSDYQQRAGHDREAIEKAEVDLERILSASPVDMDKVQTALNAIGALNTSARLSRIETLIKGRAVLSPDQQAKLQALVAKESGAHGYMMRRYHGRDDGERETK